MSFRDNLQHLRATRNMTQEQLAMLLGVSRQSVTKWEAEKSYPEMDKLIKICQIFECSLDDLVQGDLTARPKDAVAAVPAAATPQDVCGYDELQRKAAWRMPTGVALIIAGTALCAILSTSQFFGYDGAGALQAVGPMVMFAFIAAALALLVPAGMELSAFNKAHPYIEDFYTQAEKDEARRSLSRAVVVGVAIILAALIFPLAADGMPWEDIAGGIFILFVAGAAWIFIHWGMLYARVNIAQRNENVVCELEESDLIEAEVSEQVRERIREARGGKKTRKQQIISGTCGIIMICATIIGLVLLFGPALASPDLDTFDPIGTPTTFFWLPWPIGALLCGVATIAIETFYREK